MNHSINLLILTIILVFILGSCKPGDEEVKPLEPVVKTINALIGPEGGVYLSGSFNSYGAQVTATGFIYASNTYFINDEITVYDESDSSNSINYFLATGIYESVKYYYKAFVETGNVIHYGETLTFVSDGNVSPRIDSISAEIGHIGDTISIYGDYFINTDPLYSFVFFSNNVADIISITDTLIRVKVPVDIEQVVSDIKVRIGNKIDIYSSFKLYAPIIGSVEPLMAHFVDTIYISGDHFDIDTLRTKVFFGIVEARVIFSNRNLIKTLVPIDLESSSEPLKVISQLQETVNGSSFKLTPPVFNFDLHEVYADQEITIEGDYFHPVLNKNKVTFEDVEADLISGDKKHLQVKISLGPYPRRKAILKVQVLDLIVAYEIDLNVLDRWIMVSNSLPFRYYRGLNNAVVAGGVAYAIAPAADLFDENKYLWKFIPEDYSWEQSLITFPFKWTGISVSNYEKFYVYSAEDDGAFWEFNPGSQQWTQRDSFPGERRDWATHFAINGNVYVGMGADFISNVKYADFYKYSPSSDTWEQIADFPYQTYWQRTETSSFTIDGIAYVGNGATNTGMFDYWSYHPSTDDWIRIADFYDARHYTASFALFGYGYVTGGTPVGGVNKKDCWRYDPDSDLWIQVENIGHIPRAGHFAFSLDDKAYLGGGVTYWGSSQGYDFYEYKQ